MMNEKEALQIIESMISSTKQEVRDNGFFYILWGWLVFISALTDYTMLTMFRHPQHALVWGILMPLGGVISIIASRKQAKQQRVKTYIDQSIKHLTIAFSVSLAIVCFIMPMTTQNWRAFYPTIMVLYAFGVYMFGGILQYKPLTYGAFACWALATLAFFVGYKWQLLLIALAVVCCFIIPGHMLKYRQHKNV